MVNNSVTLALIFARRSVRIALVVRWQSFRLILPSAKHFLLHRLPGNRVRHRYIALPLLSILNLR